MLNWRPLVMLVAQMNSLLENIPGDWVFQLKKIDLCFFCETEAKNGKPLHKVTIFKLDSRVRRAAKDTNNTLLYSKPQNGDTYAQDALYHSDCICNLYKDAHKVRFAIETNEKERKLHGLAFSKVISFITQRKKRFPYSNSQIWQNIIRSAWRRLVSKTIMSTAPDWRIE